MTHIKTEGLIVVAGAAALGLAFAWFAARLVAAFAGWLP